MPRPQPSDPDAALHTTALCRSAGVTRGQLRICEREGLLEPPPRTAGGYRAWPPGTTARLARLAREQLVAIDARIARLQVVREYVAAGARGDRSRGDDPDSSFLGRFLAGDAAAPGAAPPPAAGPAAPLRRARPVRG
ncbi:MAG: MerR family DNA-binding transcriptional regulator [Pseudomonadota bacterium]